MKQLKTFLVLWASQAVSTLGSSMTGYALVLWVYSQNGTATGVALLSMFMQLPSILLCFAAGALADKWDKKRVMLVSDLAAATATAFVLVLHALGNLQIWHLYLVNFLIGCGNAFQHPASYVAVSLLAPKEQYTRVGALQAFSGSVVGVLTPAFGTALMAFGGLQTVLLVDLCTFGVAFVTLLLFIKIPTLPAELDARKESFLQSCAIGLKFLREHRHVLNLILFFSFINLLAYSTGYGVLPAMLLSRPAGGQTVLGLVSSSRGIGALLGSVIVAAMRPAKDRWRAVFLACALAFGLENLPLAMGRVPWIWMVAAFAGEFCLPFLNANLSTIMREEVPIHLQGRVFSTRDTLQYATIPIGLYLGGFLADHVFEPWIGGAPSWIHALVGAAPGSGMALTTLATGIVGCLGSLLFLSRSRRPEK